MGKGWTRKGTRPGEGQLIREGITDKGRETGEGEGQLREDTGEGSRDKAGNKDLLVRLITRNVITRAGV